MCGRKILRPYKMLSPFSAAAPPITCPNCNCRRTRYILQAIGAVFFRRSRLFFREAAFFSGGEGCEWGAKQPTVGESGDKAENEFSGFIPLAVPRKGFSPHIPASRLFVLLHSSKATLATPQKRNIPYWYCPLRTPSLTLPPSSLIC